jgi:hypothetical protein
LHAEGHFISDHGSPVYPVMRFYHNTLLRRTNIFRDYYLFGLGAVGLGRTERDVFNNIFVQMERTPGVQFTGIKQASELREGGNLLWGVKASADKKGDPFAKFRASKLFVDSRKHYEPGWTTQDRIADPRFVKLDDSVTDLRLQEGSPAVNAGQTVPRDWPDPLREADKDAPDIGALPLGVAGWGVGVDGRIPVLGESKKR